MQKNRSVPTDTILPHAAYQDVAEALAWLCKIFGFTEHYRYGDPAGPISGAQMHLGNAWIMVHRARPCLLMMLIRISKEQKRQAPRSWRIFTKPSMASSNTQPRTSTATVGSSHGTLAT